MKIRLFSLAVALFALAPLYAVTPQLTCQGSFFPPLYLATPGVVRAWGAHGYGQLGDGTFNYSNVPVPVVGLTDVAQVSAGTHHSLALKCDGTVWAWGYNSGQLGDGTTTNRNVPVI